MKKNPGRFFAVCISAGGSDSVFRPGIRESARRTFKRSVGRLQRRYGPETRCLSAEPPLTATPADRAKGTPAVYGDTKTQAISVLGKIEALLKEQGLTMGDVVMMHVYLVADPATGKMDFSGMNAGFTQFFGTKEQPNKPAKSTVQVAGLVGGGALIEIDAVAAKPAK